MMGLAAATGVVIDEKVLIPLGSFGFIGALIWWVGRKFQSLDDSMKHMNDQVGELGRKVDRLPCQKDFICTGTARNGKPK